MLSRDEAYGMRVSKTTGPKGDIPMDGEAKAAQMSTMAALMRSESGVST